MSECPVVKTIREIVGAGIYKDEGDTLVYGGEERVCDEMSYYIMSRKLEWARFEMSKPAVRECRQYYANMLWEAGMPRGEVYIRLFDRAMPVKYVYLQFTKILNLIADLSRVISAKVSAMAQKSINVSLPDIIMLPWTDEIIVYRPDTLCDVMNRLADYVNAIDIRSISDVDRATIPRFEDPPAALPRPDALMPALSTKNKGSAADMMETMKAILDEEMEIATYMMTIEKYHCDAVGHMNKILTYCESLVH